MTIQTLRPTADVYKSGFSYSTGTSAFALVDDSPDDDTSYIFAASGVQYPNARGWLDLANTVSVSATQRVKQIRLRARIRMNVSDPGHGATIGVDTRWPTTGDGTFVEKFSTSNVSTFQAITGTWRTKPPAIAGTEWTKSIIDSIQFYINWYYSIGSVHANLRVSELYFDADVRDQPVVTGVTVTNVTSTTRPTVTWQFNANADGDPQSKVQVKIFSAAQYGMGGFDPASSASVWDSGEVVTNSTTLVVGTDLLNGTTYKAYVAAAQDWNGGTFWWSTWVPSAAFTIALAPPPAPILLATPDPTVPNYRMLLDLTAPINLLGADAASFESSLAQWTAETNCSISRVSTDAADGTWSMQLSSTAAGAMSATSGTEPLLGLTVMAGTQYTALASFRAGTTGRSCTVGIRWMDNAGATISTDMGSAITDTNAGYTQAFVTATAPANAKSAMVRVNVAATGGVAELHRVDKVDIHVGTSQVWTVGGIYFSMLVSVERGERIFVDRAGTDRCITPSANWAHPQVATGGSVQRTGGYGFRVLGTSEQIPWEFLDVDLPGGSFTDGKMHWMLRAGTANTLIVGAWFYGGDIESTWQFPVVVNQTHTFSFWAWVASGTLAVTPRIEWMADDALTTAATTTGGIVTLTTTPQRVSVTAVAPTGTSSARGTLQNHTASATADISLTRIGWGLGSTPVDDQPGVGGPLVWSPVRFVLAQQSPVLLIFGVSTGQRVLFADYEASPGRPLLYRARTAVAESGQAVAGAYSSYATALMPLPTATIILDPVHPEQSVVMNFEPADSFARTEDSQVFHPSGRDRDPVYVQDWLSGAQGSLILHTASQADLIRLQRLFDDFTVVLIQWKTGGQLYARITGQSSIVRAANVWQLTISYDEVARPAVT